MSLDSQTSRVILYLVFFLTLSCFSQVTEDDFYDITGHTKLKTNYAEINTLYKFPHWSDNMNNKINIVESGIVRLSGFEATNTLDILVLATAQPIDHGGGIWYQEYRNPSQLLKDQVMKDINEGTNLERQGSFKPISIFIATWKDVEFYSGRKSSFQVLLATNETRTITIIKIAKITIPTWKLNFYPELDTRFSYEEGTKFKRGRFLKNAGVGKTANGFEINSGNEYSHIAAVSNSNSGLNGRWIVDLTTHPNGNAARNKTVSNLPNGIAPPNINDTDVAVAGKFVFKELVLDGSLITKPGDNNEISVILSKKNKDSRYIILDTSVKGWLDSIFTKASNSTPQQITIVTYKVGSLVVEYSVEIPNDACQGSRTNCINQIETDVRTTTKNEPEISTDNMKGKIDESKTQFLDLDECAIDKERTDKMFCDSNAYCVEYPGQGSYACICKDGYSGNGKVGNCKKQKNKASRTIPVIGGVGGAAALLLILFSVVIWYVKKSEKKRFHGRMMEARRIIPRDMLPKKRKSTTRGMPGRSTRKVMIPARYGEDFEVYHRT